MKEFQFLNNRMNTKENRSVMTQDSRPDDTKGIPVL